jgi:hypothetical protein
VDRCEEDWYASDNNLRRTPRGSREKPNAGRCRAVPWPREERHGQSMAWARHGRGMANVNQTQPHCVNQMGKSHSKPLAARHGRGIGLACYV